MLDISETENKKLGPRFKRIFRAVRRGNYDITTVGYERYRRLSAAWQANAPLKEEKCWWSYLDDSSAFRRLKTKGLNIYYNEIECDFLKLEHELMLLDEVLSLLELLGKRYKDVFRLDENGIPIWSSIEDWTSAYQKLRNMAESADSEDFYKQLTLIRNLGAFYSFPSSLREFGGEELERISFEGAGSIRKIPSWIGELASLKCLRVRANYIDTLPEEMSQLSNLLYLDLSNNELSDDQLPIISRILDLPKLKMFDVSGNNNLNKDRLKEIANMPGHEGKLRF